MFTEQSDQRSVSAPHDVFDRGGRNLRNALLLLNVVQDNRGGGAENEARGSSVEDLVGLDGCLDRLHN